MVLQLVSHFRPWLKSFWMILLAGLMGSNEFVACVNSGGLTTHHPTLTLSSVFSLTLRQPTNKGRSFSEMQRKLVKCWRFREREREMQTATGVFYCVSINTLILFHLFLLLQKDKKSSRLYFLSPCEIACVSSLFHFVANHWNKTDFRADFLRSPEIYSKNVFINILYYVSEETHNFFELLHEILWL